MLNEKKFLTIYEDYKSSGLTVREYCSNLGMNEAKFYYWKKKLKDEQAEPNGFIPVVFKQKESQQLAMKPVIENQTSQVYEICYPNGTILKLNGQTDIEVLQRLLGLNIAANV